MKVVWIIAGLLVIGIAGYEMWRRYKAKAEAELDKIRGEVGSFVSPPGPKTTQNPPPKQP